MSSFWRWLTGERPSRVAPQPQPAPDPPALKINGDALAYMRVGADQRELTIYEPPPGVLPSGTTARDVAMACDFDPSLLYGGGFGQMGDLHEGLFFPGFSYLAELTQRPEYRMISETFAREMTRKWIKVSATGDDDKTDKVAKLVQALDDFKVAALFCKIAEHDGFFGRAHLYVDTGNDSDAELKTPLVVDPRKVKQGGLKGLRVVEPMWAYPAAYNASQPLKDDFYKPSAWYVMGQLVHPSRLLTFVGREVPDYLKPSYAFAGLPMTLMAKPYVDNWLRTRQSVSDITHNFSIMVLGTRLDSVLTGGGSEQIAMRAMLFNAARDNQGLMVRDKETEEFDNVAAPLGTLDHLQAQAQEQMASVSGIPLVKLLGTTPSGLNASSDGEIRVFYDRVHAYQERLFDDKLRTIIDLVQLHLWGEIDPAITFTYEALWQLDDAAKSSIRKTDADTDVAYVEAGVLAPIEVRTRLASDENSPYHGLDVDDVPEPPAMEESLDDDGDPAASAESGAEERDGT